MGFDAGFNPLPDLEGAGFRPTSGYRTQAHQDDLRRRGLTTARRSQHTEGNAIDVAIPRGWTKRQAIEWVQRKYPGAKAIPTNGNSIHITYPGWGRAPDISNSRGRYGG